MRHIVYIIKKLKSFSGRALYFNVVGMIVVSLFEGIAIFLLIPMLSISGILNISIGAIPISGVTEVIQNLQLGLPIILCIYVFLITVQTLLQRSITIRNTKLQMNFINSLRLELYGALLQANWLFFVKKRKSDLINSLTSDLSRVNLGTNLCLQLLTSAVFTVIQIGLAFWLSPKMTVFVLICGVVLIICSRTFVKKAKALGRNTSEISQSYMSGITENFNGMKDIKSNHLEESRYEWLQNWCEWVKREQLGYIKLKTASQSAYKIVMGVLIALFMFIYINIFHVQTAQVLLIILIFSRLWPRFISIQSSMEQIASTIPAFKSLIELQQQCVEAKELGNEKYEGVTPLLINKGIGCRNASFRYNQNEKTFALRDVSLQIPANGMIAIVGRSGAGKSTLIDLLMGLIHPEKGQVFVDGEPLTNLNLLSLRKSIGYVSQDPFLFNTSIRENLLTVQPNASEKQMWEALEFAASADFIKQLPEGIDTIIGDRGIMLSGGERQRIVLARAILRKPSILVLDEATSALDTENETKIQEALHKIKGTMIIIVIAHRLSTIRNADQIIVLEQGKVIQKGEFSQLEKERNGLFSHLLGKQFVMQNIQ
ncbi:multidrug ABC transporter [Bacillus cereus]|nr:multidrug ABC transporter [Bacillus cereus]PFN75171.1 multidrug ABC transporter [Bacillus cereus]